MTARNTRKVEIKLFPPRPRGPSGSLVVDGVDLSNQTVGFTLDMKVGEPPRLIVELFTYETEVDGEMVVRVPEETAAALVALGWTPPEGTNGNIATATENRTG